MEKLFLLLAAHFICDYPLQGDWLAKAKNHKLDLVGETIWPEALMGHALVHAMAVYIITQRSELAVAEFVVHTITDFAKCHGKIGYRTDQTIHLACKIAWALILVQFP